MRLCLGTAQMGLKYGIAQNPQPNLKESLAILNRAVELGIDVFDSASAYGGAEEILGIFIENKNNPEALKIISKTQKENPIVKSFKGSLSRVRRNQLDGYIFHDAASMFDETQCQALIEMKKCELVKNIGVSIYEPEDADYAAEQDWIDYIQVPYNSFDQRLDQIGFFNKAKKLNKTVFARSVLLQGLLAMDVKVACGKMPFSCEYLLSYSRIIKKYGVTGAEAAIQFVKSNKSIDYLVFGVDNINQLENFVETFEESEPNEELLQEIRENFAIVERRLIVPSLW